jgi:hypothetical protein
MTSRLDPPTGNNFNSRFSMLVTMRLHALVSLLVIFPTLTWGQSASEPPDLMHAALEAMGGEAKVRAFHGLHLKASVVRNMLEESERPEGPYILENDEVEGWRDPLHGNWKRELKQHVVMVPEISSRSSVSDGAALSGTNGGSAPGSGQELQEAAEMLALSPERILITALASHDLHRLPDLTLQNVPHHAVEFTWQGCPVRVFLNADTHLPTAVEWVTDYPFGIFWSAWGDVTTRVYYSLWWLQNGIHYPLQADVFRNGLPDQTESITKLDFDPSFAADEFTISPQIRNAFATRGSRAIDDQAPNFSRASELLPGVVFIRGSWNTTFVKQEDGIVILEAPISSGYSAKVIDYVRSKYPGTPIKAVISTSDAWPHIAGLREYAARGIPIYVLDRTAPLIQRLLHAPRTRHPDQLTRTAHQPDLRTVSGKTAIGTGENRLEIYPMHGETSERQMMVYFPQHKLLYGSDAFQQMQDGTFFYPQTVYELKHAVERENLKVDRFFMMHIPPTAWSQVVKIVQDAS